ncbi:DUF6596 domain-containing protein [Streptomyces sp. NPDC020192]|uniref:DUF6596 domain-containing protein n=1 Tax=Streptomyces sp. NPDC020192 TaxID=3365066 RepID=UPI0037A3695E
MERFAKHRADGTIVEVPDLDAALKPAASSRCPTAGWRCVRLTSADPAGARDTRSLIERLIREEAGRLTAGLVRLPGDFDLAEEMVGEAVVEVLRPRPSTCCPPALDADAQVALTLRAVVGLTTAEIARVPGACAYLLFNEGCFTTGADLGVRRALIDDAERLAALLAGALPQEPEPLGPLALIRLHAARRPGRLDTDGRLVLRSGSAAHPPSSSGRPCSTGPAPGRSRPPSPPCTARRPAGRRPTGPNSYGSTACCWPSTPH